MTRNDILNYINKHFFTKNNSLKSNFSKEDTYYIKELDNYVDFSRSPAEKIYLFLNSMRVPPKCRNENCINYVNFKRFSDPYTVYCSKKCMSSDNNIKNKRKATCIKLFGSDNCFSSSVCKEKIKETNLKRYGTVDPRHNNNFVLQKANKTNLEKYGFINPSKSSVVKEKIKKTNLEKYGIECSLQNNHIIEKIKKTNLEKYGFSCASKSEIVKNITKKSNIDIYGNEFFSKTHKWKESFLKTKYSKSLEKYSKYFEPLFTYNDWVNRDSPYDELKWKCKKCGTEFYYSLCNGCLPRCTTCYPINKSFFEKDVGNFIESLNVLYVYNDRQTIKPLELDINIPSKNIAIECDGIYWHSLRFRDKNYHLNKTNLCKEKNIHLIHIFENEWFDKTEIVKSIIKSSLNIYNTRIGARNCLIRECTMKEEIKFFNENHLQAYCNSTVAIGLYYNDELVSCISFVKPRFNKNYDWELLRFANKLNTHVMGSFGRLWKYRPKGSIITYSDKRYFTGNVYKKYFHQLDDTKPSYFYIKNKILYSRLSFQKSKLKSLLITYDEMLTEQENMQLNGFDIIYDCGNYKFEYIPS